MADKRLEDIAALKAQLEVMDDLQLAKEDVAKLRDKCSRPMDLQKIQKPKLKADTLKEDYQQRIEVLQDDITALGKRNTLSTYNSAPLFALFFLLAVATAIATFVIMLKVCDFSIILLLGVSAAVFFAVIFIANLIDSRIEKKNKAKNLEKIEICKQDIKEIRTELNAKLAEVEAEDNAALKEYESRRQQIIDNAKAEFAPLIKAKEKEIEELNTKYKEVAVISSFTYSDRKELKRIIWALEEQYAESIPEARRWLKDEDERKRREEEERHRQKLEEERKRKEDRQKQEEERKRNSPGTVVVYTMEDNKGKNAEVYVDGNYYGAISFSSGYTSFQLSPGHHNVSVIIQSQSYLFQSGVESFYLEGGKTVNIKFAICGYNNIRCTKW